MDVIFTGVCNNFKMFSYDLRARRLCVSNVEIVAVPQLEAIQCFQPLRTTLSIARDVSCTIVFAMIDCNRRQVAIDNLPRGVEHPQHLL